MRVLLSNSPRSALRFLSPQDYAARYGALCTPQRLQPLDVVEASGAVWALDNAAFSGFSAQAFEAALAYYRTAPAPLFVVVPDVVANAKATRRLWDTWQPRIEGYPLAYVLQDGQRSQDVPWDTCAALFVGGTTAYKLGIEARKLIAEGRARGKHIHMGRVNTKRRLIYALFHGCDTVDGSGFARFQRASLRLSEALFEHIPMEIDLC